METFARISYKAGGAIRGNVPVAALGNIKPALYQTLLWFALLVLIVADLDSRRHESVAEKGCASPA